MSGKELVTKIVRLKPAAKAGITLGAAALIAAMYNFMFYVDIADGVTAAEAQRAQLQTEKESYEKRKREYLAYRNELTKLQEEQRELLKALPKNAEIPSFLQNLQEQAELCGIEIMNYSPEQEIPEDLYVKIPVKVEVRGTFHGITKFFKNISELRRIVNIETPTFTVEKLNDVEGGAPKLRAKFVAATFKYQDGGKAGS